MNKQFTEAMEQYDRIREDWTAFRGHDDAYSQTVECSTAIIHSKCGEFEVAEKIFQSLLPARQRIFGEHSLIVIDTTVIWEGTTRQRLCRY